MEKLRVDDVLLQTLVTLINLGARKAGLAAPPGEEPPERDLGETKQAIDGARALLPLLEPRGGAPRGGGPAPERGALARREWGSAHPAGGAPAAAAPAPEPEPPAQ